MAAAAAGQHTLDEAVRQYLLSRDYRKTCAMFQTEAPGLSDKPPSRAGTRSPAAARVIETIEATMDLGDAERFFEVWHEQFGQSDDEETMKLEFYLQIYFAVFPVVHGDGTAAPEAMSRFRQFLENRGATLAQTTEFLPYYALPFVANLREHPSFESLFSTNWSSDLRFQLGVLLDRANPGALPPVLCAAWAQYNTGSSGRSSRSEEVATAAASAAVAEARELAAQLKDADDQGRALLEQHHALQKNYHTLIGTAAELVEVLESSIRGVVVKPEYLMKIVGQLNGFSSVTQSQMMRHVAVERAPRLSPLRHNAASAEPRAASKPEARLVTAQSLAASMENAPLPQLDDAKIRKDLLSLTDRNIALLLQALRWRVTRSRPGVQRKGVLDDFAICDYLGIGQPPAGAVYALVRSGCIEVREYLTRLLNCLASIAKGREYMLRREMVLVLVNQMFEEDGDTMVRQNILGTLQKLSLRRKAQSYIIEHGTVGWLCEVLAKRDDLCEYSEEYAAALLMNLCLRSAGRRFCEIECPAVLELLRDMLAHESDQVRTYVHGAVFRLLGSRVLRERAAKLGFETAIRARIETSSDEMATQLDYILNQLGSNEFEEEDEDSDDENDDDDVEGEGDDLTECDAAEGETVVAPPGTPAGEQLLCSEYLRHRRNKEGFRQNRSALTQLARDSPVLVRPVTPVVRTTTRLGSATSGQRPSSSRVSESRPSSSSVQPSALSRNGSRPRSSRPPSSRAGTATSIRSQPASRLGPPDSATASRSGSRMETQAEAQPEPPTSPALPKNPPPPSEKVLAAVTKKIGAGSDVVVEYNSAFATRPKVPRTPGPQ